MGLKDGIKSRSVTEYQRALGWNAGTSKDPEIIAEAVSRVGPILDSLPPVIRKVVTEKAIESVRRERVGIAGAAGIAAGDIFDGLIRSGSALPSGIGGMPDGIPMTGNPPRPTLEQLHASNQRLGRLGTAAAAAMVGAAKMAPQIQEAGGGDPLRGLATADIEVPEGGPSGRSRAEAYFQKHIKPGVDDGRPFSQKVARIVPEMIMGVGAIPGVIADVASGTPAEAAKTGAELGEAIAGDVASLVMHPLDTIQSRPDMALAAVPTIKAAGALSKAAGAAAKTGSKLGIAARVAGELLDPTPQAKGAVVRGTEVPRGGAQMHRAQRVADVAGELGAAEEAKVMADAGLRRPTVGVKDLPQMSRAEEVANAVGRGLRRGAVGGLLLGDWVGPIAGAAAGVAAPYVPGALARGAVRLKYGDRVRAPGEAEAQLERLIGDPNYQTSPVAQAGVEAVTVDPVHRAQALKTAANPLAAGVPQMNPPGTANASVPVRAIDLDFDLANPTGFLKVPEDVGERVIASEAAALDAAQEAMVQSAEARGLRRRAERLVGERMADPIPPPKEAPDQAKTLMRQQQRLVTTEREAAGVAAKTAKDFPAGAPSAAAAAAADAARLEHDAAAVAKSLGEQQSAKRAAKDKSALGLGTQKRRLLDLRDRANKLAGRRAAIQAARDAMAPDAQVMFDMAVEAEKAAVAAEDSWRSIRRGADKEGRAAMRRVLELEEARAGTGAAAAAAEAEIAEARLAYQTKPEGARPTHQERVGQLYDLRDLRAKADAEMEKLAAATKPPSPDAPSPAALTPAEAAAKALRNATRSPQKAEAGVAAAAESAGVDIDAKAVVEAARVASAGRKKRYSLSEARAELKARKAAADFDAAVAAPTELEVAADAAAAAAPPGSVHAALNLLGATSDNAAIRALARTIGPDARKARRYGIEATKVDAEVSRAHARSAAAAANPRLKEGVASIAADDAAAAARKKAASMRDRLPDEEKKQALKFAAAERRRLAMQDAVDQLTAAVAKSIADIGIPEITNAAIAAGEARGQAPAAWERARAAARSRREALAGRRPDDAPVLFGREALPLVKTPLSQETMELVGQLASWFMDSGLAKFSDVGEVVEMMLHRAANTSSMIHALNPRVLGKVSTDLMAALRAEGITDRAITGSQFFQATAPKRSLLGRAQNAIGRKTEAEQFLRRYVEDLVVRQVQPSSVEGLHEVVPTFRLPSGKVLRLDDMVNEAIGALGGEGVNPRDIAADSVKIAINNLTSTYLHEATAGAVRNEVLRGQSLLKDASGRIAQSTLAHDAIAAHMQGAPANIVLFDPSSTSLHGVIEGSSPATAAQDILGRYGLVADERSMAAAIHDLQTNFVEVPETSALHSHITGAATGPGGAADKVWGGKVFVRFGYGESVGAHLEALQMMTQASNWLAAANKHARLAFTAGSTGALIANSFSNAMLLAGNYGVLDSGKMLADAVGAIRAFDAGALSGAPARKMRSIMGTGIADSSIINDIAITRPSFGSTKPIGEAAWDWWWNLRANAYKQVDSIPKLAVTMRHYDDVLERAGKLGDGKFIQLEQGGGRSSMLTKDAAGQLRLDGRPVSLDSQGLSDAIAKHASRRAADVFFDFSDMGLAFKTLKQSGAGLIQPLAAWTFKAMEKPNQRGIVGHFLNFDPDSGLVTNDPALLKSKARGLAGVALRRAGWTAALNQVLEESERRGLGGPQRETGAKLGYTRGAAVHAVPGSAEAASRGLPDLVSDVSSMDFTTPLMNQVSLAVWMATKARDILNPGGSPLEDDPVKLAKIASGEIGFVRSLAQVLQATGGFEKPFVRLATDQSDKALRTAFRAGMAMIVGTDGRVALETAAAALGQDGTHLTGVEKGESAVRYALNGIFRVVGREKNGKAEVERARKRLLRNVDDYVKGLELHPAEAAVLANRLKGVVNAESGLALREMGYQ